MNSYFEDNPLGITPQSLENLDNANFPQSPGSKSDYGSGEKGEGD